MMVAQQLYEGIDLGPGEPVGLITYMRTDSTRVAAEAANEALDFIRSTFGESYAINQPRQFKNRKKAQDAHEAIRPTSVLHTPDQIRSYLNKDQLSLYSLIWKRFVASQMAQAQINQNSVAIDVGAYRFNASGTSVKFPGFMTLYQSVDDERTRSRKEKKGQLPELAAGMVLNLHKYDPKQHFTQPPPRFSEASLVKELEENGIGRPSTYATILSTIRDKGYVDLVKGYFRPNELGFIVNDLIVDSFPDIIGVDFTAKMENNLDRIEAAKEQYQEVLARFYNQFKLEIDLAAEKMISVKGVGLPTGLSCPQCNKELVIKIGKNGHFLACSGYPECNFSRDYTRNQKGQIEAVEPTAPQEAAKDCSQCGRPMVVKRGRYGEFLACSGFPECTHTESINGGASGEAIGVSCPQADCTGEIVEKKSKRGKIFYGCNRYPDCTFATWDQPIAQACPVCQAKFIVRKQTKKRGAFLKCLTPDCGYEEPLAE